MIDLGDYVANPLRIGSYSRRWLMNGALEIGIAVKMTLPIGTDVALEIDGQQFRGMVVESLEGHATLSDGVHECTFAKLEGRFSA